MSIWQKSEEHITEDKLIIQDTFRYVEDKGKRGET